MIIRDLGHAPYLSVWESMRNFTQERTPTTNDELWMVEHPSVFTQGQAGKAHHILDSGDIPIVQSDRGGQVTYHGPGQIVIYTLIDVRRSNMTVRQLVNALETGVINYLSQHNITARARCDAPGVYIDDAKICSIGLRIKRGCSYHGIAFNADMDLAPFKRINPCGFKSLKMTQLRDFIQHVDLKLEKELLSSSLAQCLENITKNTSQTCLAHEA